MNCKFFKKITLILVLLFISAFTYAELGNVYFPLTEGKICIYQDFWEIQDPEGKFETESECIGEKVRVKRIDSQRTLRVLSVETEGDIKRVKMKEEDYQGARIYKAEYQFPLKVGAK